MISILPEIHEESCFRQIVAPLYEQYKGTPFYQLIEQVRKIVEMNITKIIENRPIDFTIILTPLIIIVK